MLTLLGTIIGIVSGIITICLVIPPSRKWLRRKLKKKSGLQFYPPPDVPQKSDAEELQAALDRQPTQQDLIRALEAQDEMTKRDIDQLMNKGKRPDDRD